MKIISALLILVILGGCSLSFPTKYERNPADTGYSPNALKKSKCACREFYKNGRYL